MKSQWVFDFFGLPAEYSGTLHKEIFTLTYYGGGGFTFSDVYDMPVHLRKFYLIELIEAKKKENTDSKQKTDFKVGEVPDFVRQHAENKNKNKAL